MGEEILGSLEQRESLRVEKLYKRVAALIQKSKEEGFQVENFEARALRALRLNNPKQRDQAVKILLALKMDIPRKKVQYIPMNPEDEALDIPENPSGRAVSKRMTLKRR